MKTCLTCLLLAAATMPMVSRAVDLREATFTQVVNSVSVTNPQGTGLRPAQVNTKFTTPEIIRTGADSRAELTASDQTVTRVGANTIFSFKPEGRGINLQQGSVLFNSPSGRGGGTIQTAAATASVLGTTIIVVTTGNGGFKLLVLEGKAKATLPNGRDFVLKAGQMSFISPGQTQAPQVFEFRLGKQNEGSNLLKGFSKPLPAQDKVQQAIVVQDTQIANGQKSDTGLMIGQIVGDEIQVIDPSLLQTALRTLIEDQDRGTADLIKKLQAAVTVDQTLSTSIGNPENALLFKNSDSFVLGLLAIDAQVGLLFSAPDNTLIYAAKNLYLLGPTLDLSPFSGISDTFAFFAKENLVMAANLTITGYGGHLIFHADDELTMFNYSSLYYNGSSLELESWNAGGLNLGIVTISNSGSLSISNFGGNVSLTAGTFTGSDITILASGNVNFSSSPTFNTDDLIIIAGGDFTTSPINYTGSNSSLYIGVGGTATVSSTTLNLGNIYISAGDTLSGYATTLNATDNISLFAGTLFDFSNSGLLAGDTILLSSDQTLQLGNSGLNADTIYLSGDVISSIGNTFSATTGIYFDYGSTSVYLNNSTLSAAEISIDTQTLSMSSTTMTASSGILSLYSTGTSSLSGNTLYGSDIEFTASTGTLSTNYIYANNAINASASGLLTLSGNTFTVANSTSGTINVTGGNIDSTGDTFSAAKVKMYAVAGTINVNTGTFTAKSQLIVNGKNVNIGTSTFSSGAPGTGAATFSGGMSASDVLNVSNANFNTTNYFSSVSMQAYTINLTNVDFASGQSVYLTSGLVNPGGMPTFGSSTPGRVNFIGGVKYGGNSIYDNSTFTSYGSNIHLNQ